MQQWTRLFQRLNSTLSVEAATKRNLAISAISPLVWHPSKQQGEKEVGEGRGGGTPRDLSPTRPPAAPLLFCIEYRLGLCLCLAPPRAAAVFCPHLCRFRAKTCWLKVTRRNGDLVGKPRHLNLISDSFTNFDPLYLRKCHKSGGHWVMYHSATNAKQQDQQLYIP